MEGELQNPFSTRTWDMVRYGFLAWVWCAEPTLPDNTAWICLHHLAIPWQTSLCSSSRYVSSPSLVGFQVTIYRLENKDLTTWSCMVSNISLYDANIFNVSLSLSPTCGQCSCCFLCICHHYNLSFVEIVLHWATQAQQSASLTTIFYGRKNLVYVELVSMVNVTNPHKVWRFIP